MPGSSTGRISATGPATSRPTRLATSGSARDAIPLVGMPHFRSNTFEGQFPTADLVFSDERFPGDVGLARLQPVHPAGRPRLEHPGRDVRDHVRQSHRRARSTTRPSASSGTAFVHRPGRRAAAPPSPDLVRVATDEERPDAAGLRRADPRHGRRRHESARRICTAATGSMRWRSTGTTCTRPGPFAERDYGTRDYAGRHGPQPRQQPRRGPRLGRAERDADRALRRRLVCAQLSQVLGLAHLALPPGVGRERPVAELVRHRVARRRRDRRARS